MNDYKKSEKWINVSYVCFYVALAMFAITFMVYILR